MTDLKRAVADLRADLTRHEGGLVKVFADQLEAVLDALESAPVPEAEPEAEPEVVESFEDLFKGENGLFHLGLEVKLAKRVHAYPNLPVGKSGMLIAYNYNSRYVYRVHIEGYATINLETDEVTLL